MATMNVSAALQTSFVTALKNALDAGAGPATIEIYNGSMPASVATAVTTQVLLGVLTCSDPCGTISGGTLTFSAITPDAAANADGTATWARFKDSTGAAVCDMDVSVIGGGGALQANTVNIVINGPISLPSLTITFS